MPLCNSKLMTYFIRFLIMKVIVALSAKQRKGTTYYVPSLQYCRNYCEISFTPLVINRKYQFNSAVGRPYLGPEWLLIKRNHPMVHNDPHYHHQHQRSAKSAQIG